MKTLLIAMATTFVLGCGSAPSQEKESTTTSGGDINLPDNGEQYTNPCDVPSYQKLVVDGRVVVVEVPTLCNEGFAPDRGDPCPDCGDPNPEKERSNPDPGYKQISPLAFKEMGERQSRTR